MSLRLYVHAYQDTETIVISSKVEAVIVSHEDEIETQASSETEELLADHLVWKMFDLVGQPR